MKRIPVNIPLQNDGSFIDVLQDFINTIQTVTGGEVDIECSLKGELTIYFEGDKRPVNKNKHPEMFIDFDALLRGGNIKSLNMSDSKPNKLREE